MSEFDPCKKCKIKGDCCCYAIKESDKVIGFKSLPCKYLDKKTGSCTVYKDRFSKCSGCLTVKQAIEKRAFPNECYYVKDIPGYQGKEFLSKKEETERIKALIEKLIESGDKIPDFLPDEFKELVKKYK